MTKNEMSELLETVLDLALHGLAFSQKDHQEVVDEYLKSDISGYYPFLCGWLKQDLEDIVKVLQDKGVSVNEIR